MRRKKRRLIFEDEVLCIGCGHRSKGKYFSERSDKNDSKEITDLKQGRDTLFEALGFRKVPGGWKCNNCTGIKGRTAHW